MMNNDNSISPDALTMTKRLNQCFESLFYVDSNGSYEPNVCCFCDAFITKETDISVVSFKLLRKCWPSLVIDSTTNVSNNLKMCYYVDGREYDNRIPWEQLFLSRKTSFVTSEDGRRSSGLISCSRCKKSLSDGKMPKFAIANGFYFGYAPTCLSKLSEVELAFLTPVKTYGYCFSYSGGIKKQLKGSLSFYKVEHQSIA
jgi:hypothetical protein